MWVVGISLKHDCVIGNRCEKFNCITFSISLNHWNEKGYHFVAHRHTIEGNEKDVDAFIKDLKKDKRIVNLEISNNTIFIVEKRRGEGIPSSHYDPRIFFVKPVFVDRKGVEHWEVASYEKEVLMKFLDNLRKEKGIHVDLEKFHNVKLDTIYFPKIMPSLSPKQRESYQLAVEEGYYRYPRKATLKKLAQKLNISIATFQEHLRRAESKILPNY